MPKVISNTTPVLSLLRINKLSLLKDLYGKVMIPDAVYREIEKGKDKEYYEDLRLLPWIEILGLKKPDSIASLTDIDEGEAEVLMLAKEQNADLLLMDEKIGRNMARNLKFRFTGTIGILLKAKEKGLINSVTELLNELIEKGVWMSAKLIAKTKHIAEE